MPVLILVSSDLQKPIVVNASAGLFLVLTNPTSDSSWVEYPFITAVRSIINLDSEVVDDLVITSKRHFESVKIVNGIA
jgi:hypothetical protein